MKSINYLVECVPNISEGRDLDTINRIVNYIKTPGMELLNVDIGYDANRTVLTLVGSVEEIIIAVKKLYQIAAECIDMSGHYGEHPRLGAVDVCPFIPFKLKDKTHLTNRVKLLAKEISDTYKTPVFLYADSSLKEANKRLPVIRKGGYENIICDTSLMRSKADFGPHYINRPMGGTVMGVRDFMIAYNVNLDTTDLNIAKSIAKEMRRIREIEGRFNSKCIKPLQILGWYMEEYKCCQISTNIHNPRVLSLTDVYAFTQKVAESFSVKVNSSEIIGMIPFLAKKMAEQDVSDQEAGSSLINFLGLDFNGEFDWSEKILTEQITR